MGVIYKRNKYWIDYRDAEGRRYREVIGTSKREAEKALAVRKAEIVQGKFNFKKKARKISFREFAAKYLDYARINKRSWRRDETSLKSLVPIFGETFISKITEWQVESYKIERRRVVKEATVNREVALLKHMLTLAVKWGDADENPVRNVKLFRENNLVERVLTQDEEIRLLQECAAHLRPIVIAALNTGMRLGEILSLTWSNVNLKDGFIVVTAQNSKSRRLRRIPINSVLRSVLVALPKTQEIVFPSPATGRAWHGSSNPLKTSFYAACRRAKITGLRFHDLRHTFASRLVAAGVSLVDVSKLLGHAQITTTMRYAHVNSDSQRKAVEKLCDEKWTLDGHHASERALTGENMVLYLESSA